MTPMQPENIPGNYQSGRAALDALVCISAKEAQVRDALMRANHMVSELTARLNELKCERKDSLRAIDIFADIAPASLGVFVPGEPSTEARDVEAGLSLIEQEVKALLARKGGE